MNSENKRGNFTGTIGIVLAAAGSAVGLGNIWRFPYLAAKDNGGVFIFFYIILALTFGLSRQKSTIIVTLYALIMGIIVCLGYNLLYFEIKLPNGNAAQILDIMDYISNNTVWRFYYG